MRAAIYHEFECPVEVTNVPDPTPPADGVVLEVRANGVCRSDWHAWKGHDRTVALPHVPGHEMAGVVVAAGPDVHRVLVGDRITVPFVLGCGECPPCSGGHQQLCDRQYQPGFDGWGAFAQFVALPRADVNAVALPDGMDFTTAAGLGCRFSTAFRAVVDQGAVGAGTTLAVWGCGGVGLSAVMIAAELGAEVFAVDIDQTALGLASRFGARHVLDATEGDMSLAIRELTGGGVDVAMDALGSTDTAIASIRSLRKRGRHVQVGLMIGDHAKPVIPMWRLHAHEIELHGVHGMPAWRYPAMLDLVLEGRLDPASLVTETFDLAAGARHLMSMDSFPGSGFAVIDDFGHPATA